jgi:hypothetical protein
MVSMAPYEDTAPFLARVAWLQVHDDALQDARIFHVISSSLYLSICTNNAVLFPNSPRASHSV